MEQPWGDLPEENYDAGRLAATYKPSGEVYDRLRNISGFPVSQTMMIFRYAIRAEAHLSKAMEVHGRIVRGGIVLDGPSMRDELELMVYCMRKCLDHLIHGVYATRCADEFVVTKKLLIDSIGRALAVGQKARYADFRNVIFEGNGDRTVVFLRTLNAVSNSYKHGYFLAEAQSYFSLDFPNILLFDVNNNDISSNVTVHNHNAIHFMMGFQDVFNCILKNMGMSHFFTKAD